MGDTAAVRLVRLLLQIGTTRTGNAQGGAITALRTAATGTVTKANVDALENKAETTGPQQYWP